MKMFRNEYRARIRNWARDWYRPWTWPAVWFRSRESKLMLATLAMVVAVITTIAAVPGIFSSVNSTSGYKVNGSVGSSGQALCSDGTFYSLPCSVSGSFVAAGDLSGSLTSQNVIGIQTHALPSLTAGYLNYNGSAWLYSNPLANFTSRTCNANGCYEVVNGTVRMWGHTSTPVDGSPGNNVCLPFAFPSNFDSATITDDFGAGATGTPSVAALAPSGAALPFPCTNGGFLVRQTRAGNGVYWEAIGN